MIDVFSPKTFVMSKEEAVLVIKEFRKYQRLALQPIMEFCKKNKVVNRVDLSNDALLRQIANQKHVGALASVLIAEFPQMENKWDEMDNLLHAVKLPFHCRYNCENSEGLSVWFHYPLPEAVLKRHGTESMKENARAAVHSLYHQKQPAMELFGLFEKWWEAKEISYWHICHGAKARPNIRETSVLYKNADTLAKALAAMSRPVEGESAPFPFMVREGDPKVRLKEHKFLKDVFTIQHYLLHPKSDFQMTDRFEDDLAVSVRWKGMPDEPDVFMHVSLEDLLVQANLKFVAPDGSQYSKRKQLLSKYIPVINKQLKAFRLDNFGIDLSKFPYDTEIFCCGDMDKLLVIPANAYDSNGNIFRDVENFMEAVNKKSGLTGMTLWRTGDGLIQTDNLKVKWTDTNGSVYLKID